MELEPVRDDRLGLQESLPQHRVIWRLQPVVGVFLAVVAFGSLAGLFSDGWISRTHAVAPTAEVVYERFVRLGKAHTVEVRLNDLPATVAVPLAYFGDFRLEGVVPEPLSVDIADAAARFDFDADGHAVIRFHLVPQNPGGFTAVWTVDGVQVPIRHFTYP